MLVSPDNDALLDSSAGADRGGRARRGRTSRACGRAWRAGAALSRAGDWYGRPVNLASRITAIARPQSVLCAAEVRDVAADGYRWSHAGRRRLKGITEQVNLFRVRRDAEPAEPEKERPLRGILAGWG